MKWGEYQSYHVVTNDHLQELNELLVQAYADNLSIIAAENKYRNDFVDNVRFDALCMLRHHILIKRHTDPKPCGSITIYKDVNNRLPLEECLNLSLEGIREKNISICEVGRLAILASERKQPDNILLLFCEVIIFCIKNKIQLLTTQAFVFNHQHFSRLGFNYFKGFHKGCYDSEFDTTCFPMYVDVSAIFQRFSALLSNKPISDLEFTEQLIHKLDAKALENINIATYEECTDVEFI